MRMTRRGFFSASAALAALPALVPAFVSPLGRKAWGAPLPRDAADIVVIGAGAAGIAAARRIVAANRKVVVSLIDEKKCAGVAIVAIVHDDEIRKEIADRVIDVTDFAAAA